MEDYDEGPGTPVKMGHYTVNDTLNFKEDKGVRMIKLYQLTLTDEDSLAVVYDICNGGIVAAETEEDARRVMSGVAWYEGRHAWLKSDRSDCVELKVEDMTEGVISANHNPG